MTESRLQGSESVSLSCESWPSLPTAPIDRDRTEQFMRCNDCGGATTIARIVFEKHQGDYVLCATCTSRTTEPNA